MTKNDPPAEADEADRAHAGIRRALCALARLAAARAEALAEATEPDEGEERRLGNVILSLRRLKEVDDRYEKQCNERAQSENAAGGRNDIPDEDELEKLVTAAARRAVDDLPESVIRQVAERYGPAFDGEYATCEAESDPGGERQDACASAPDRGG